VPGGGPELTLTRRYGVPLLTAALATLAIVLVGTLSARGIVPIGTPMLPWWVLAALYAVAEGLVIHLVIGRETHSFALSEVPLVLGLFLATPTDLVLGQLVGASLALAFYRRQPVRKLTFNLASFAFSTAMAIAVFALVADPSDPWGPRSWLAAYLAALTADLVSGVAVQMVIAVSSGEPPEWSALIGRGTMFTLTNASIGLVGVILLATYPSTVWLTGVLVLAMLASYRISVRHQERHQRLTVLHEATRSVQESLGSSDVVRDLLDHALTMFGAERAELVLAPAGGSVARRLALTIGEHTLAESTIDATQGVWARVASEGAGLRLSVAKAPDRLRAWLEQSDIRHLMSAPIRGAAGTEGALTVINRMGNVGGWPDHELPLLETLANHAAVAIRNGELMDGLAARAAESEHAARHDPLTGLPNRPWFVHLVELAMADQRPPTAMLAVELESVRDVNETLGQDNGDSLLCQAAQRLGSALPDDSMLSRLDGPAFALVTHSDTGGPVVTAERIAPLLDEPFELAGLMVAITARIGIAARDDQATTPEALLRRASQALQLARERRTSFEMWDADRDAQSPERLALAGELRRAIEERELTAWFQPKADLRTGAVVGAEALARWIHPTRGMVRPDQFIPIVEQSNLLRPMTLLVLDLALAQCARWRAEGHQLSVAVNLSARNLLDLRLPTDVSRLLRQHGLPARALTLELTESAIMADPDHAREVLAELRGLGLRISIDDYGTGYSSLAYLGSLAVDELKIDRSFSMAMEKDANSRSIIRSTVALAHELGLDVVAEGVETQGAWDWLREHTCDVAQGWFVGRPVAAEAFDRLLQQPPLEIAAAVSESGSDEQLRSRRRVPRATSDPRRSVRANARDRVG
jgi:diguanylate cyclase (GGDEF)-like protein